MKRTQIGSPPRSVAFIGRSLLLIGYVLPLLWIIVTALKSNAQILEAPNAVIFQPTLATFQSVLSAGGSAILVSLQVVLATTVVVLVLAAPASYALARHLSAGWARVIALVLGGLLVLQMVPEPMTVIPLYAVLAQWHLINGIPGLVLCDAALLCPFAVLLLRPFMLSIPEPLYEAAALDGASRWQTFLKIALPMLSNGVVTVGSVVFIIAWGEFIYAINFLAAGSTLPVSGLLAQQISAYSVNWNSMMALAVLTSLPLIILFLLVQKQLVHGLSVGAVK